MWKWVYFNAPTIQAVCSVFGLIGLTWYAVETKRIREATLSQSAASRRPFMTLVISEEFLGCYELKNIGSGIALHLQWSFMGPDVEMRPMDLGSCAVHQRKFFLYKGEYVPIEQVQSHGGIRVTYTDTADVQYWSTFTPKTGMVLVETGSGKL
jgi:cystathionine beta-lyase/cystathionine gamma-synthase